MSRALTLAAARAAVVRAGDWTERTRSEMMLKWAEGEVKRYTRIVRDDEQCGYGGVEW